ncbi:MAG: hypothetical protein Q7J98_07765 [Kiritimatiellia bacterium]|nr:hypothetical protein [Kiritimatiellia bacterium]
MSNKQNEAMRNCAVANNSAKANKSAFVLITVVILATLGGVLAAAVLYGTSSQTIRVSQELRYEKAFFIAEAGLERAKAELRSNGGTLNNIFLGADSTENTSDDGLPAFGASVNFGGGTYQVRITDNNDSDASLFVDTDETVIICSTGTYETICRTLEVTVLVGENNSPPPTTDSAVGIYGTNTSIALGGSSGIDGRDYSLPANFDCNGMACSGALTTNPAVPGVFSTESPSMTGTNKITGGIVTNGTSQFATNYWQDMADILIPQAAIILSGTYSSDTDLGTRDNPRITVATGNTTITSNLDGAGILIVMDGVNLTFSGNFHYEGIIILTGNNNFTVTGTVRIFGALVTTSEGVNISITGNPEIMYSSAALANLQNLPLNPRPLSVVYWREIK